MCDGDSDGILIWPLGQKLWGLGRGRVRDFHSFFMLFYINFFISAPIYFKLILSLSYDNKVNLNYAWLHYQPWGAPAT
jgi:hypothetical protein